MRNVLKIGASLLIEKSLYYWLVNTSIASEWFQYLSLTYHNRRFSNIISFNIKRYDLKCTKAFSFPRKQDNPFGILVLVR